MNVSRDKLRIAENGGWATAIPQIAGTTIGMMKQNPCVEAMKSRPDKAQAIEGIKGGLWGKI